MSVDWISPRVVPGRAGHIAVVDQPYLDKILSGLKTIESRLSTRAIAPFEKVGPGDTILLKVKSGPIVGRATVKAVSFLRVRDVQSLIADLRPFQTELRLDAAFLRTKRDARFFTLMRLEH